MSAYVLATVIAAVGVVLIWRGAVVGLTASDFDFSFLLWVVIGLALLGVGIALALIRFFMAGFMGGS